MLPEHKLLLKIGEQTLLRKVAEEIECARFFEVLAVTGHEHLKVEKELRGLPLKVVYNDQYEKGIHSSIREGILHLSPETDFFAVCLADQPLLTYKHYNRLIEAAQIAGPGIKLIHPSFKGKRGNPVLVSMSLIVEILGHSDSDKGCSYLFERYPNQVMAVEMDDEAVLLDVDTPQVFEQVKFHLEKEAQ